MKNKIEILLNNFFEYENFSCICKKETIFVSPDEPPKNILKVCSNHKKPMHFSYVSQKGLCQSGNAGGIISENLLGQLLSIPSNDFNGIVNFFEKYGYLLPISSQEYESIDSKVLFSVFDRIKATVKLMSAIAGEINYGKVLMLTTYLLYTSPAEFQESTPINSCTSTFQKLISEYNAMPELQRNQELFDYGYLSIQSTVFNNYTHIDKDVLIKMVSGEGTYNWTGSNETAFKHLFALFVTYKTDDKDLRKIIDFYYHYQTEVGIFSKITVNKLDYYLSPKSENFTDELKKALVDIAKIVISDEINRNLQNISPQFDMHTFSPTWKLNSLLEALYFSVFYMKPGVELYKECENPSCKNQKYFLINSTVTNKKYCCSACGNAASQRRSRQRKLQQK